MLEAMKEQQAEAKSLRQHRAQGCRDNLSKTWLDNIFLGGGIKLIDKCD